MGREDEKEREGLESKIKRRKMKGKGREKKGTTNTRLDYIAKERKKMRNEA